ncbi:MAG: polymerase [Labilithrix sp.]|nr:polymerase [Labilithrix sp.]
MGSAYPRPRRKEARGRSSLQPGTAAPTVCAVPRAPSKTAKSAKSAGSETSAAASSGTAPPAASRAASVLPPAGSEDVLYLMDLSGYVYRSYHALPPLSNSKGEVTHATMGTVNMIQKVVNDRRPTMLAVAMDSRGPSFRKQIDERYKATRQAAPEDLSHQMSRCEQFARAYNIPIYRQEGVEADDLIAAVVERAVAEGVRVVIVSADKDLMQLVNDGDDRVLLWDSMREKTYGPPEVEAKFGVVPSKLRDLLALTGDTSDNIPGVPSVGPKTAADLLKEFGTIENLFANLASVKRPKLREALEKHEADARISQVLVTLKRDLDIGWDKEKLRYGGANVEELRTLFTELEFTRLLDQMSAAQAQLQSGQRAVVGAKGAGRAIAMVEAAARNAAASGAPAPVVARSYRHVVERADLEAIAARAREAGTIALYVAASAADSTRAQALGLGLAIAAGEGFYVPFEHRYLGAPRQLAWSDVTEVLGPLLADPDVRKVGYDLKRVENILARHDLPLAGRFSDPMLAAYLLDPEAPNELKDLTRRELGTELALFDEGTGRKVDRVQFDQLDVERATTFAAPQAELALAVAERLDARVRKDGLGPLYDDVELPLSRVLSAMERKGVLVDTSKLATISARVELECNVLEAKAQELAGRAFAIRSRDQLETLLFDDLQLPVVKRTLKGGRSTDAAVLEELADKHALPSVILEFRELDKLKGTYLDALPRAVNPDTGRIHTRFEQAVAATGRLSSNEPNLQNIPIRKEVGRLVRSAFVAPPGHQIVSADYSQIELRVLAHLAKDEQLAIAFRDHLDVHEHTASLIFDVPRSEVSADMRRRAKAINFGLIYGMGEARLAREQGISREEARRFMDAYFERFVGVRTFMNQGLEGARAAQTVHTILGRRRFVPNLASPNRGLRFEAERVAKNTPIQGTAADILKLAMIKLGDGEVVKGARMILTVHDELVFEVPDAGVAEAERVIKEAMESAFTLDVPLVVDVGHGQHWGDAH